MWAFRDRGQSAPLFDASPVRQFVGGGLAALAFVAGGYALAQRWTDDPAPAHPAVTRCAEDDPCWDCATMGNRICGPR
jgi:hypothetical protein